MTDCCPHCLALVPHHTNSATSIGGADRHPIWDLHMLDDGSLAECWDPIAAMLIHKYRLHTEGTAR